MMFSLAVIIVLQFTNKHFSFPCCGAQWRFSCLCDEEAHHFLWAGHCLLMFRLNTDFLFAWYPESSQSWIRWPLFKSPPRPKAESGLTAYPLTEGQWHWLAVMAGTQVQKCRSWCTGCQQISSYWIPGCCVSLRALLIEWGMQVRFVWQIK